MLDVDDRRPVDDILWPDDDYRKVYDAANLELIKIHKPLGKLDEQFKWVNETNIPPWSIYVLKKQ